MSELNNDSAEIDCPYCAEKIKKTAKKCKHCHEFLDEKQENAAVENIDTASNQIPKNIFTKKYSVDDEPLEIWNPNVATCLSLFFTPIFGALIHAKNWRSLNDIEKTKTSMLWVYGYAVFLTISVGLSIATDMQIASPLHYILSISALVLLLVWYFTLAKKQYMYVKHDLKDSYKRKSYLKPLLLTFAAFVVLSCFAAVVEQNFTQVETADVETASALDNFLSDISGDWEVDDEAQISLYLSEPQKSMRMEGSSVPVKIEEFNELSRTISIEVNNDPKNIWLIQQIINPDGESFYLSLTVPDGTKMDLHYSNDQLHDDIAEKESKPFQRGDISGNERDEQQSKAPDTKAVAGAITILIVVFIMLVVTTRAALKIIKIKCAEHPFYQGICIWGLSIVVGIFLVITPIVIEAAFENATDVVWVSLITTTTYILGIISASLLGPIYILCMLFRR